jgi:peptide/nickel transport system permease protein
LSDSTTIASPGSRQETSLLPGRVVSRIYRSTIVRLIVVRLLQTIPVLFGVTFILFTLLNVLPGGTAAQILGTSVTPALLKALTIKLGLNHPFIIRYFHWLRLAALHGNLGTSLLNGVPVATSIGQRLPVSAEIGFVAFVEAMVLAVPVAILAARRPRGVLDRMNLIISMFGISCPVFVLALIASLVFAVHLHWLPAIGYIPLSGGLWANLRTILLPASSIAFGLFAAFSRILRADLIDQMNGQDYVITARSVGLADWAILIRYAFRNAVFNLITVAALYIGTIIAGTVLVEQIFGIPGMGTLLIEAISYRDEPTVLGIVSILACIVVVANLLADLLYAALDPRIRHGNSRV